MNTETKKATQILVGTEEEDSPIIIIDAPVFILFAEFLGYVSIFNKQAEDWCDGKVPEMHVQKVLIVEAKCIFRQMKKDYTIAEIREFYTMYYPLILQEYEEKLASLVDKNVVAI
jgi:hypothetical protein